MDKNVGEFSWSGFMLSIVGILIVIFRNEIPVVADLLFNSIKDFISSFSLGMALVSFKQLF